MQKQTRKELEYRVSQLERENSIQMLTINRLAAGEFKTVGKASPYIVRIADCKAAHGGIVLVTFAPKGQRPMTTGYVFEDWYANVIQYGPSADPELLALRDLALKAHSYVSAQQNAA